MADKEFASAFDAHRPTPDAAEAHATHLSQEAVAQRWEMSTATLERWRSEGVGPRFLKLRGKVRYRLSDILDFERSCLRRSTAAAA